MQLKDDKLTCDECGYDVAEEDKYCPRCGSIFESPMYCATHSGVEAEGVCVICRTRFCHNCGSRVSKLSLCLKHERYEVLEGKARIFGEADNVQAQYAARCLEQAGFHPFLYSRHFNPGGDIASYFNWRQFGGHILGEIKVLLPFNEVLEAEEVLKELDFKDSESQR